MGVTAIFGARLAAMMRRVAPKARMGSRFSLGAFERHFNALPDDLAGQLLDRINEIVQRRWPDAS